MLLELLEHSHILDYIEYHSGERGGHDSKGNRGMGGVTWDSLFRSAVGFIARETEAIQKLEEKGIGSTTALSNRLTKKKVLRDSQMHTHTYTYAHTLNCFQDVAEMLRAYIRACNKREFQCCYVESHKQ